MIYISLILYILFLLKEIFDIHDRIMKRLIIPLNAHWLYKSSHSKKLLSDKEKMIKRVLPFKDTFQSLD